MKSLSEFKSCLSYGRFKSEVLRHARFVHDEETKEFLRIVLDTGRKRVETWKRDRTLWRAQLGSTPEVEAKEEVFIPPPSAPFPDQRMKPLPDRAREGRANPKGIPCLYAATGHVTALAEVRPWKHSLISIVQMKTSRDLTVLSCVTNSNSPFYIEEPDPGEREIAVWESIDAAFSRPVTPSDDTADYAPTQILAELFRSEGLDGVTYRSSLGPDHNVALFDLDVAEIVDRQVFQLKDIILDFERVDGGDKAAAQFF
jgi:hypothetical protein